MNGILMLVVMFQDMSVMRDYIAFAQEHIHPKLSEEAQLKLINAYVDMRYCQTPFICLLVRQLSLFLTHCIQIN